VVSLIPSCRATRAIGVAAKGRPPSDGLLLELHSNSTSPPTGLPTGPIIESFRIPAQPELRQLDRLVDGARVRTRRRRQQPASPRAGPPEPGGRPRRTRPTAGSRRWVRHDRGAGSERDDVHRAHRPAHGQLRARPLRLATPPPRAAVDRAVVSQLICAPSASVAALLGGVNVAFDHRGTRVRHRHVRRFTSPRTLATSAPAGLNRIAGLRAGPRPAAQTVDRLAGRHPRSRCRRSSARIRSNGPPGLPPNADASWADRQKTSSSDPRTATASSSGSAPQRPAGHRRRRGGAKYQAWLPNALGRIIGGAGQFPPAGQAVYPSRPAEASRTVGVRHGAAAVSVRSR